MIQNKNNGNDENKKRKTDKYKASVKRSKIAGILCLIIVAGVLLMLSPIFDVEKIEIVGNSINSDDAISKASGVKFGDNIFSVDASDAKNAIMKLENVSDVKIRRVLPSTVIIEVSEYVECAYITVGEKKLVPVKDYEVSSDSGASSSADPGTQNRSQTEYVWEKYVGIDENGKIVKITNYVEKDLPYVTGIALSDSETGQYIKIDSELYAKETSDLLCRILSELKKQDILSQIKEINLSDIKNIQMILDTDTLVNLGEDGDEDGDNIEYKIAFLKAILDEPRQNGGVIELSDTDNVTERSGT